MPTRLAAILAATAIILVALAVRAPHRASAEPPDSPGDYVVVRYRVPSALGASRAGAPAPSLRELGYESVPVPRGVPRDEFLARLRSAPGVVSAEADVSVFAAETPNDPFYPGSQASYLSSIGAPVGWGVHSGSDSVVVAVLDTGIDTAHPDLAGQLWANPGEVPGNGADDDGNGCTDDVNGCRFVNLTAENAAGCGYTASSVPGSASGDVRDDHGKIGSSSHSHGSIVSGILAATGNNGVGIAGVAWDVRLMPIKVLDCGAGPGGPHGDLASVAYGIDYARLMGADIINLSLATSPPHQGGDLEVVRNAIQAAQDEGIIIVCAAGNWGSNSQPGPGYPAAYTQFPNVIAVGASDNTADNTWASYSSYGPALDFAAPGNEIVGALRSDLGLANPYGTEGKGTSFSAPIAAGMFALLMARNSGLEAADYIAIARASATPAAPAPHGGNWAGSGVVNIGAALQRVPLMLSGSALHDWKDVNGAELRAMIDQVTCGSGTASGGLLASFTLTVAAAPAQPGCGALGKTVQLLINGAPASPTIAWGGRNADLNQTSGDYSSVSPLPGPVVVQVLGPGWSNIAHFEPGGPVPGALTYLPNPWTDAYSWEPLAAGLNAPGAYHRYLKGIPGYANDWTNVKTYGTFWVKAPAGFPGSINPNPPAGRIITFYPGWNNFVYTGSNRAVADALTEVSGKFSEVLRYDNGASRWLVHLPSAPRYLNDFGALLQLNVYWIYIPGTVPVALTMN